MSCLRNTLPVIILLFILTSATQLTNAQALSNNPATFKEMVNGQNDFSEYCNHMKIATDNPDRRSLKKIHDNYELFSIKYEMAKKKGTDTLPEILEQEERLYKMYFDSIQNYEKVTEKEIKDAYYRLTNQREISHIQVNLPEAPYPADTLEPFRKIMDIYQRLNDGEDFNALAYSVSDNFITRADSGFIGPVSFGSLNYPMEVMAYSTGIGEYSTPFQTWPGYQVIKVHSENPAPGFVDISHIAMRLPASEVERKNTLHLMDSLRSLLLNAANFEDLARRYSEDESTSIRGGYIGPVAPSFMIREMSEAAFALEKDGDISPVVITERSVHIIKRIAWKPLPGFDQVHDSLRQALEANQARAHEKKVAYYNRIKSAAGFVANPVNVSDYLMLGRICLQQGRWVSPPDSLIGKILFSIEDKTYTYNDLSKRMERGNYPYRIANYRPMIWKHYIDFKENILDEYLERNFDKVYPEVATKLEWEMKDMVIEILTEQEVLQKLSYSMKEMENIYRKNKKKYTDPAEPGRILSFEDAFQEVLIDYQAEGVRNWEKGLLRGR